MSYCKRTTINEGENVDEDQSGSSVLQQSCNRAATELQQSCNRAATELQQRRLLDQSGSSVSSRSGDVV
jgi:hypothetical protein